MKRKYAVTANDWDDKLKAHFGTRESVHELTDANIVRLIVMFGRAEILEPGKGLNRHSNYWTLDFQNTYD